jgi:orotidine-5'-phosphate decarboxylase
MHADSGKARLIVALDVETAREALALSDELGDVAGAFKIGSRLFTSEGPVLVRRLVDEGHRIFLDLKFHDIPNTVAQAVDAAVATGAWMVNVHAAGGRPMMEAAARAGVNAALRLNRPAPVIIGVTVLTSMDAPTLSSVGVDRPLLDQVTALADLARQAGLHGVVASPLETGAIRAACGDDFVIVTPGIRGGSASSDRDDQSRTMGPAEAIRAGASYIVVGRPIIGAVDRRAAAAAIADDLAADL